MNFQKIKLQKWNNDLFPVQKNYKLKTKQPKEL